jgi:putative nucleotidyltransferase with HDIG domain
VLLGKIRVAGLLHDIGALAMQFCFPDEYKKVQDFQKQQNVTIIMAERKYFGIDHCEVGTKLCLEWGLPAYLMECAREHHNQICKNHENIIMPVIVANAFLNVEVEQVQTMDYKPLLITFCPGHPASENEARLDVQSFLYAQWKAYQQSLDVPQS